MDNREKIAERKTERQVKNTSMKRIENTAKLKGRNSTRGTVRVLQNGIYQYAVKIQIHVECTFRMYK